MNEASELVAKYCAANLGDPASWTTPDGYPNSLAMCVLDSVWSLGVNYDRHVVPVLNSYRELRRENGADADRDTASDIIAAIGAAGGPEKFADRVNNHQKTSTHAGAPLKAEAVLRAADVLARAKIETPHELTSAVAIAHSELKRAWKKVPGQTSSDVGWRYLLLLAGNDEVKPDRMVQRFVATALGRDVVNSDEAASLLTAAATKLNVPLRSLDHAVWRFQSGRGR